MTLDIRNTTMDNLSQVHHPTNIKLGETIELSKCKEVNCCRYSVHCPFCDVTRLKPLNAFRIRDHLEVAHFQHGIYYEDWLLVKCYQNCKQKTGGHYHCPVCPSTIIKRLCFQSHLLSHTNKQNKNKSVISMPDAKHPQEICCHDYTVKLCGEKCVGNLKHHYHCPVCGWIGHDRSVLITHLWRCVDTRESKSKKLLVEMKDLSSELHKYGAQENIPEVHPKYNSEIKWHVSMVRTLADLPLDKCTAADCCDGLYHCILCPLEKFTPSQKQNLINHYMSHWKTALTYKGYCIMCCYNLCGKPKGDVYFQAHYHCPVCGALRRQKETMFSHIQICQGEGIKALNYSDVIRKTVEGEQGILTDIEMAEDSNCNSGDKEEETDSTYFDMPLLDETNDEGMVFPDTVSENLSSEKDESKATEDIVLPVDTSVTQTVIRKNEVFDSVTAVVSSKLLERLGSEEAMLTLLQEIATRTKATWVISPDNGPHVLIGDMDTILETQTLLLQSINGPDPDSYNIQGNTEWESKKGIKTNMNSAENNDEVVEDVTSVKDCHSDSESKMHGQFVECTVVDNKLSNQPNTSDIGDKLILEGKQKHSGLVDIKKEIPEDCLEGGRRNKKTLRKHDEKLEKNLRDDTNKSKSISRTSVQLRSGKKLHDVSDDGIKLEKRYSTRNRQLDFSELAGCKKRQSSRHTSVEVSKKKSRKSSVSTEKTVSKSPSDHTKKKSNIVTEQKKVLKKKSINTNMDHDVAKTEPVESDDFQKNRKVLSKEDDTSNAGIEQQNSTSEKAKGVKNPLEKNNNKKDDTECEEKVHQTDKTVPAKKLKSCNVAQIPVVKFLFDVKQHYKSEKKKQSLQSDNNNVKGNQKTLEDNKKENFSKCSICEIELESFSSLTSHLKQYHEQLPCFRCDVCERIFSQKCYLDNHLQLKHGPKNKEVEDLSCPVCHIKHESKSILHWHMSKFHGVRKPKISKKKLKICGECSFQTSLIMEMRHHKLTVHSEVPQCEYCGRHFAKVALLKTHIQTIHTKEKSCVCHVCGKAFNHVRYLRTHMKRHGGEKKHACAVCGWRFYDTNSLKDHMETHKEKTERIYKYICSYCGKGFRNKANFNDHQNKHTGNKPYQCGLCGRCFGFRSELQKHNIFVHSSDKPFKCYLCEKAFKLRRLRDNHMSVHSGQSDHVCKNCQRSFSCKSTLKVHEAKCHRIIVQDKKVNPEMRETLVLLTEQPINVVGSDTQSFKNIVIALPEDNSIPVIESERIECYPEAVEMVDSGSQNEVYLCSECHATFDSYSSAEQHIVFYHANQQMTDVKSELPLPDSIIGENVDSVSAIIDNSDNNLDMSNQNSIV